MLWYLNGAIPDPFATITRGTLGSSAALNVVLFWCLHASEQPASRSRRRNREQVPVTAPASSVLFRVTRRSRERLLLFGVPLGSLATL